MDAFLTNFLFSLLLIRLISGTIVFYIICWDTLHPPVALHQVVSSLVLDDEIQDIKEEIPDFGKFLCLHIVP